MGKAKVVNGGRIRRVTITEIDNEEQERNWINRAKENDKTEEEVIEKTTDEIFAALDDVVTDWKIKLEVIVGDGLKKIKKASKEKKAMMKYLPGDGAKAGSGTLVKARADILNDWKVEVAKTVKETHNKLNELGNAKVKDVVVVSDGMLKKVEIKVEKNTKVSSNEIAKPAGGAFMDLKKLMRELDSLYQAYSFDPMHFNKVPIYTVANQNDKVIPKTMNMPFSWWRPVNTLAQMVNMPKKNAMEFLENDKETALILQDFVAQQVPYKTLLEEWFSTQGKEKRDNALRNIAPKSEVKVATKKEIKAPRRGSRSIIKMKERKEQRQKKQFELREFEDFKKGEKHFLVVRKKVKDTAEMDVEDIFADWSQNLSVIKRPRTISAKRVRKISHRQERKELLRDSEEPLVGPFTYAQMARKGLHLPREQEMVEDIFQSWRRYLDELTDITNEDEEETPSTDELDYFQVWKHNMHVPGPQPEDLDIMSTTHPSLLPGIAFPSLDCGQPTVKKAVVKKHETSPPNIKNARKKSPVVASQQSPIVAPEQSPVVAPKKTLVDAPKKSPAATKKQNAAKAMASAKADMEKPKAIPIPPPPPPPSSEKMPYEAVAKDKQIMAFTDKKPAFIIPPPPPMPKAVIPLPDLTPKKQALKPTVSFTPRSEACVKLSPPVPTPKAATKKVQPTAEQIYEAAKKSSPQLSWQNMIPMSTSPTGRGDSKRKLPSKPEEVFASWKDIFVVENKEQKSVEDFETIFKEWAELNLKEPEIRTRRESEKEASPKTTRKETKKLIRTENIEDDMIEVKDNRRHAFAKNAAIKDKKRGEASRNSTGKRIK